MATNNNVNGPAIAKRVKISKTQQQTLLIALVTSTILGVCGVLAVFFGKYISFNKKVIEAKDESISGYEATIKNVGLCKDTNNDGKFSEDEIKKCNPDALDSSTLVGTLRYNVLVNMANNIDLESVARGNLSDCLDSDGKKINWQKRFDDATDDSEQAQDLAMLKMCSALRVIPDALPAQANEEALMSSLNQVFIMSDWEPENLSPSGSATSGTEGISTIPISLAVEATTDKTRTVLNNIEKSIRTFDLQNARIAWSVGNMLSVRAQGVAYYTEDADVVEESKTVYASEEARKKGNNNR